MIQAALDRFNQIPSTIPILSKTSGELVRIDKLIPGENYNIQNGLVKAVSVGTSIVLTQEQTPGVTWTATYTPMGLLHGPVEITDTGFSCRLIALNGGICGRVTIKAESTEYSLNLHGASQTYVAESKSDSKRLSRDRAYYGFHNGHSELYNHETGTLVRLATYYRSRRHGVQGNWFKDGTARRVVCMNMDHAHGMFCQFHLNGDPSECGQTFFGEKTGGWRVWAVGRTSDPHEAVYTPKLPIDWLSIMLDDKGRLKEINPEKPEIVMIRRTINMTHKAHLFTGCAGPAFIS